jgi:tRNA pseudouridine65 synthase
VSLPILAEGPDWLAVAKPGRLLVHRNEFAPRAPAALQLVRDMVGQHVHLVHRLDHQASGVLLFALTPERTRELQAAMQAPTARKRYLALVRGAAKGPGPVTVDKPMKDDEGKKRDAFTVVWRLAASEEPRCSLLLAEPRTGRFHQVRRHLRDLGHPIVGDTKHGDSHVNRAFREAWGVERLALHAWSLDLPDLGIAIRCPLPEDLRIPLARMPWWDEVRGSIDA